MAGHERGDILPLVCYIIALVLCIVAIGLSITPVKLELVVNCLLCSTGSYVTILSIFILWSAGVEEIDKIFAAWVIALGAILNIIAGLVVTIFFAINNGDVTEILGGLFAIVAGALMVVDVLATLGRI